MRTIEAIAQRCGVVMHVKNKHKATAVLAAYAERTEKQGDKTAVEAIRHMEEGGRRWNAERDGRATQQERRKSEHENREAKETSRGEERRGDKKDDIMRAPP